MSYEPTIWQDHITEYPGEYEIKRTERSTYNIVPVGNVLQEGTPQNAENFNKMEMALLKLFEALSFINIGTFNLISEMQAYDFATDRLYHFSASAQVGALIGSGYCYGRYYVTYDSETDEVTARMLEVFNSSTLKVWKLNLTEGTAECVFASVDKQDIADEGAKVTLTLGQIDALDKLFEKAVYKDDTISADYNAFVTAFGLDQYRVLRTLNGSEISPCSISNYYDVSTYKDTWKQYNGIPYTYTNVEGATTVNRSSYPYFDIPAEGGYSYQIYFEANDGVQLCLEFYNETALTAIANGESFNSDDKNDGYGWQTSMGYEWLPPTTHNDSPIKAMRLIFNNVDAGVQKVIIYRKKVV